MSIPEACIEATYAPSDAILPDEPRARARHVILELAENLPDSAVEKACETFYTDWITVCWDAQCWMRDNMRAAIVAALKDVAGETP